MAMILEFPSTTIEVKRGWVYDEDPGRCDQGWLVTIVFPNGFEECQWACATQAEALSIALQIHRLEYPQARGVRLSEEEPPPLNDGSDPDDDDDDDDPDGGLPVEDEREAA